MNLYPFSSSDALMYPRQFHPAQTRPACIYRPLPWHVPKLFDNNAGTLPAPNVRSAVPGPSLLVASDSAAAERGLSGSDQLSDGERPDDALSGSASDDEWVVSDRDDPDNAYILARIRAGASALPIRKINA